MVMTSEVVILVEVGTEMVVARMAMAPLAAVRTVAASMVTPMGAGPTEAEAGPEVCQSVPSAGTSAVAEKAALVETVRTVVRGEVVVAAREKVMVGVGAAEVMALAEIAQGAEVVRVVVTTLKVEEVVAPFVEL